MDKSNNRKTKQVGLRELAGDNEKEILELYFGQGECEKAFRLLVGTYSKPLYYHIRRLVILHDDADDVLQNTMVNAWRGLPGFKGESKLFSWLYRIATNEALAFLKEKARRRTLSMEDITTELAERLNDDSAFVTDQRERKLQKAILELPERQRLVFNMKYCQGMKYSEIAQILNLTEGALKASFHHAVEKLKVFVQDIKED